MSFAGGKIAKHARRTVADGSGWVGEYSTAVAASPFLETVQEGAFGYQEDPADQYCEQQVMEIDGVLQCESSLPVPVLKV